MSRRFFFNLQGTNESLNFTSNSHTIGNVYITGGNVGINTTSPSVALDVAGGLQATNVQATNLSTGNLVVTNSTVTNAVSTNVSTGTLQATNAVSTNVSTGTLQAPSGITVGNINFTGSLYQNGTPYLGSQWTTTSGNVSYTSGSVVSSNLVATNSTVTNVQATTLSAGNIAVSGNLSVAGTLTTVNMTTTNLIDTNVSAGNANITSLTSGNVNATNITASSATIWYAKVIGATSISEQGLHLQWNRSGGDGEAHIINQKGLGGAAAIILGKADQSNNFTEQMRITDAGNVGIGTSTPIGTLEVNASGGNTSIKIVSGSSQLCSAVASGNGLYSTSAVTGDSIIRAETGKLHLQSGTGGSAITINSSGNVGIGTTAPGAALEVNGGARFTNEVSTNITSATLNLSTGLTSASAQLTNANVTTLTAATLLNTNAVSTNVSSATLNLSTGLTSASAQLTNANVTTLTAGTARITSNLLATGNSNTLGNLFTTGGNVGIRTTSPGALLDVSGGNFRLSGLSQWTALSDNIFLDVSAPDCTNGNGNTTVYSNSINLKAGDLVWTGARSYGSQIYIGGGYSVNAAMSNSQIKMSTSGVERLRISELGYVGIGTTAPAYSLDVNGTAQFNNLIIKNTGTNYTVGSIYADGNWGMLFRTPIQTPGIASFSFANYDDTKLMTITSTGNVGIGTNTPAYKLDVNGSGRITNAVATNVTSATLNLTTGLTSASAQLTNANITTLTASNIAVSGNLSVAGTLTTVNLTTTNLIDTNITAGSANITNATIASLDVNNSSNPRIRIVTGASSFAAAIASVGGAYSTSAVAGDSIIRAETGKLHLQSGTGVAAITIHSSGNVGIGATNPAYRLDLGTDIGRMGTLFCDTGNSTGTLRLTSSVSANYIQSGLNASTDSAAPLVFTTINAAREWMRITTSGNVGIGTQTPSSLLTIQGPSAAGQTTFTGDSIEIGGNRSSDGVVFIDFHTAEATYGDYSMRLIRDSGANGATTLGHRGTGAIHYICQEGGAQIWATSNTERMRLTAAGNVGIGTAAPSSRLQVSGNYTTGTYVSIVKEGDVSWGSQSHYNNTRYINCTGNAEHTKDFNVGPGGVGIGYAPPSYSASGADGLYVNGNVGIGTAAPSGSWSLTSANGINIGGGVGGSIDTAKYGQLQITLNDSEQATKGHIALIRAGSTVCHIRVNEYSNLLIYNGYAGVYMTPGGQGWAANSDRRLKTDFEDIVSPLDKLAQIKGTYYKFLTDSPEQLRRVGVIAQDVQIVLPEAISQSSEDILGVNYTDLIPLAIEAIKELKAEKDVLQSEVNALKAFIQSKFPGEF